MTEQTKWHVRPAKAQISLGIRPVWSVFAVSMKKAWVLSYPWSAQQRLWSDSADAQADPSLCYVGFVKRRIISQWPSNTSISSAEMSLQNLFVLYVFGAFNLTWQSLCSELTTYLKWSTTKPTNHEPLTVRTVLSASLLYKTTKEEAFGPWLVATHKEPSKDWSKCSTVQADVNVRLGDIWFCEFCRVTFYLPYNFLTNYACPLSSVLT